MNKTTIKNRMVQYGVWPNCCNDCDFCLRLNRIPYTKNQQIEWLNNIEKNLDYIDWENEFSYGISLLGGELYYITDVDVQDAFMRLIDKIIDVILIPSKNPECQYSSVTNGLYDPSFLYKVIDRIVEKTSIKKVDLNFSYDLKYRYKNDNDRLLVLKNINDFHKRYDYSVGVQMILTQYLINLWKDGKFDVNSFIKNEIPGNMLCFLYPHKINTGKQLDDFNFSRSDFLKFMQALKTENEQVYSSFINSTKNSGVFKYTGYRFRSIKGHDENYNQQPVLSDGKEHINPECGHSMLYKCYSDTDKCMLCDIKNIESDYF